MPRKKRDWYPGATYHVMCRGIRRMAIFKEEEDYEMFLLMMKRTMERFPFVLHSYCMMTNHIHLQITTVDSEIWKIMKDLLSNYARNFNNKYGYCGHLFDSRYTSCLHIPGNQHDRPERTACCSTSNGMMPRLVVT